MMTGPNLERRVAEGLHADLDRVTGPHPDWVGSPAAARIAAGRGRFTHPGRLIAAAFVLLPRAVPQSHLVLVCAATQPTRRRVARRWPPTARPRRGPAAVPGQGAARLVPGRRARCRADDRRSPSQVPSRASYADARGPVVEMRLRDVHDARASPTYAPVGSVGRSFMATADVRVLRGRRGPGLGPANAASALWPGGDDPGAHCSRRLGLCRKAFPVPIVKRTLGLPIEFSNSSTVVFDVPASIYGWTPTPNVDHQTPRTRASRWAWVWILRPGRAGEFSMTIRHQVRR